MGWLVLALLCPPLLPVVLLFWVLDSITDAIFGGSGSRGGGNARLPPPPKLPVLLSPADPFLFQPVPLDVNDAFTVAARGAAVEAPGALCLLCGEPKAVGNHDH